MKRILIGTGVALAALLIAVYLLLDSLPIQRHQPTDNGICINNLKQIGICLAMYREENGNVWPETSGG